MLLSIHIENIAVVRCASIDFCRGLVAMTGETGAGKSVILDSLGLLLGARSDKEFVRSGESSALVQGVFADLSEQVVELLSQYGISPDDDGCIFIQRTLRVDGKSQIKINGVTVNLTVLRAVCSSLVNIHGQSDTGALIEPSKHLELVDIYADNLPLLLEYREIYEELCEARRNIADQFKKESERERLKEMLAYQIKDIDSAGLHEGEEEELVERKVKIKNSEKISKNCEFVYKALKGSEKGSVCYLLGRSASAIAQLSGVIPSLSELTDELNDMLYRADDIAERVLAQLDGIDSDPTETLNGIESRLDKISKLKRKYGLTVKDILDFRRRAAEEYETLENYEATLAELTKKENELYEKAVVIADRLHQRRVSGAGELEVKVKENLEFLDMPKVVFYASIKEEQDGERKQLNDTGYDHIEFYISANRGAEPQSISKIASGGELARIMLALKCIISDKDGISTLVFDEIDSGVSGKTARKIGLKMRDLSRGAQVICVTHSAQIASLAELHLLIKKGDVNGATETAVYPLDYEGRVAELSRILGGINVTAAQRDAAIDMLNEPDSQGSVDNA